MYGCTYFVQGDGEKKTASISLERCRCNVATRLRFDWICRDVFLQISWKFTVQPLTFRDTFSKNLNTTLFAVY